MAKKVTIRREECTSCETCWITAPEFFQQNGADGWSEVVPTYRIGGSNAEGEVPDTLLAKVQEAADSCPVQIIEVR
jgi:ferredoxin